MATTPINALRYAGGTDAPNGPSLGQNLALDLDTRIVARFASTAARDSAIPAPINGMVVWCDSPGCYFDRVAGAWVPRAQFVTGTVTLFGGSVPSQARLVHLRKSVLTNVSNAAGGFNAAFGITFAGLIAVGMASGDGAPGSNVVVPLANNHTLSTGGGAAYQGNGTAVANGTQIRVELDVVGYM